MFRVVVATYLMLAQLTAPLLCCCWTTRLASSASHLAAQLEQSPPASHTCCSHHAPVESKCSPGVPQSPERSNCPCPREAAQNAAVLTPDGEFSRLLQYRHLAQELVGHAHLPMEACLISGVPSVVPTDHPALSYPSAAEMLRAMHFLRC